MLIEGQDLFTFGLFALFQKDFLPLKRAPVPTPKEFVRQTLMKLKIS